ncbi:iron ABC transporter permease [Pseudooceanicola sp. CBS1P-1]|uniref:Iron chelate uptake ABC transporter family permease subunit n=1 Tax=Pseudooceanicola albus TaxID=2692189 RepID=A0A6L7GAI0_9RHOB|nr:MULTISPECIES: iron ABC transporter permease [Pseudooceanicola]MBT9386564.1 iron ABC transporter permease [Pseudooceanicola endophyticus]MXN20597.1 iron chelate uptake ABC transporter family permease subunit [Pseudooceanicola albus]
MRRLLLMLLALLALCALALMRGQLALSPLQLWQGLSGAEGPAHLVLAVIRGPRVAAALGTGAALGLSGMLFQTLFRNPLAAPDLMGFTSGAGLAIVLAMTLGLGLPVPLVAALGGLIAAALVLLLAWKPGQALAPLVLVLVGLGVGFLTQAASSFLMTALPPEQAADAQRWLTGSLNARNWGHVALLAAGLAVLGLLALSQIRRLEALDLGEELAAGLGLHPGRARIAIAVTGVLLAALAVSVAGPLPFVALMAGPLGARLLGRTALAPRMAAAALTGAMIVVAADLLARATIPGLSLPAGVVTGLLGAPYLLWRLSREMKKGEL